MGKFVAKRGQHSAAAATGIEQGKPFMSRVNGSGHVLAKGLVPPVMVLDRAHNLVFFRLHSTLT
jgi:hypothetical protein